MTQLEVSASAPVASSPAANLQSNPEEPPSQKPFERLHAAFEYAAGLLPNQGPINALVARNTLEAFEHLPFDEGVRTAAELYGCEPYLREERYREKFERDRIRVEDLITVLQDDLGARAHGSVLNFGSRFDIRMSMLRFPLQQATGNELQWLMAETDALRKFRPETPFAVRQRVLRETSRWIQGMLTDGARETTPDAPAEVAGVIAELLHKKRTEVIDRWSEAEWETFTLEALWRICRHGIHAVGTPKQPAPQPLRHRDAVKQAGGGDSDLVVNEVLIRFCAAFLDQGLAAWPLPARDKGFALAFATLFSAQKVPAERWRKGLKDSLAEFQTPDFDPWLSILESLRQLGVAERDWRDYLTATLLSLRGWAGMIHQVEQRGDRVPRPIPPHSLLQYLAVRLAVECAVLTDIARDKLEFTGPFSELKSFCQTRRHRPIGNRQDQRSFVLFQLAQLLGWMPRDLVRLSQADWSTLIEEVESFCELERRRIYHLAFERNYRIQVLDALSFRSKLGKRPTPSPEFQVVCCLDDREESFRRHLEEVSAETQTFGVAGFFNTAMYYRGVADAFFVPLCPIVMLPERWVSEEGHAAHQNQTRARKIVGHTAHQIQRRSQTFWGGALITAGLGALATIPLVARVLFPRLTSRVQSTAGLWVLPKNTKLRLRRGDVPPAAVGEGIGFTAVEMANCGERMLRDIGLTTKFAPLVVILGHGSSSLNNPHRSIYDCGACGGGAGGPNARAMAEFLNQPDVRRILADRGISIPETTMFQGGLHNTCNDQITLYDQERVPAAQKDHFRRFRSILDETLRRNAHERTRRFLSADLLTTFADAKRHVEARSEDLAQARPEFGHSTIANCIVGRRERTRDLFMDRRSFLVSYDPKQDDENLTILSRIMTPVVPVCVGICMQYFFSYLDSPGWGSGSKLPHNVSAMLGVMDGFSSDLRTGLPWQGVEIHEPMRLLVVLEVAAAKLPILLKNVPQLEMVMKNQWIQLAVLDPDSEQILLYEQGEFRPYHPEAQRVPRAANSWEWYRGWRENLPFAVID